MTTIRETAEELLDYCWSAAGDELRVVTRYGRDVHDPVYTREGLHENTDITEENRSMFRRLLFQIHEPIWSLSRIHPHLVAPETVTHSYGEVAFVQFPITESDGLIVTFEGDTEPSTETVSRCTDIVYGPD